MGFPSPAKDYKEQSLSLDQLCNTRVPSVYLMRYASGSQKEFIKPNSVLVINSSVTLSNGALIVVSIDEEFTVRRYVMVGGTVRLENLDEPSKEQYSSNDALFDGDWPTFFGVVTNTLSINQTP